MQIKIRGILLSFFILSLANQFSAQTNLLLNGNFEEINTCTEYSAKCGVEAWFYLNEVKVQMLNNETYIALAGNNSLGIFYNWTGYAGFTPVIGTILPCSLQKNSRYTFKGLIYAKLHPKLNLKPGICLGEKFYVPRRAFSKNMKPDSIVLMKQLPNSDFYEFEYSFVADGHEKYLAFGTFIEEDTVSVKRKLIGIQTVSLVLDNFKLIPEDEKETYCSDFLINKEIIYDYNFRHREMDYSLFGRGELNITFSGTEIDRVTRIKEPVPVIPEADTLKLGDVLFDFNKASLKPGALKILESFFIKNKNESTIDSINVEGHTDSVGSDSRNLELSLKRCESVRQWLLQNHITVPAAIQVHAFGRSKPIASNSTPQGRAMNRRVEMIVFRKLEK